MYQTHFVSNRFHLIMFIHPHCPCSRASLRELEKIIAALKDRLAISLLFYLPSDFSEGWVCGYNWNKAVSLPYVSALRDPAGIEAVRFGVATSGHALLYGGDGKLLFSGGITQSWQSLSLLGRGVGPRAPCIVMCLFQSFWADLLASFQYF